MIKEAQSALRRTMEKYSENCRIIMVVNDYLQLLIQLDQGFLH